MSFPTKTWGSPIKKPSYYEKPLYELGSNLESKSKTQHGVFNLDPNVSPRRKGGGGGLSFALEGSTWLIVSMLKYICMYDSSKGHFTQEFFFSKKGLAIHALLLSVWRLFVFLVTMLLECC